jgi:hypothetical protein
MALNKVTLTEDLTTWLNGTYSSIAESMEGKHLDEEDDFDGFIDYYYKYAMTAQDVSGDIPLLLNKTNAVNILKTISLTETPNTVAIKFENALIALWLGATFMTLFPPTGTIAPETSAIVTVNILPNSLAPLLTTVFSNLTPTNTKEQKAQEIADALDTVTKTIQVTCIGTVAVPPPPVLAVVGPIS